LKTFSLISVSLHAGKNDLAFPLSESSSTRKEGATNPGNPPQDNGLMWFYKNEFLAYGKGYHFYERLPRSRYSKRGDHTMVRAFPGEFVRTSVREQCTGWWIFH
jgi:hypothetical protein